MKENILFGSEYDAEKYEAVVEACALAADLKILPAGDQTEIGENGVTCSIFLDIAMSQQLLYLFLIVGSFR